MPSFKVLIADDERLSRRRMRRLLSLEPDCEVTGECASAEAVSALAASCPDILYLGVEMPEHDSFEVIRALSTLRSLVIFTSAFEELPRKSWPTETAERVVVPLMSGAAPGGPCAYQDHAIRTFGLHAFDYLLKPLDGRRFLESLHRAKAHITAERGIEQRGVQAQGGARLPNACPAPPPPAPGRIAVRNNGRVVLVKLEEIDWIEAADNYVSLHCGRETHVVRETMSDLESRLNPALFLRVHRSAIVNLDHIKELQPWFRGDYRVILRDGTELTLTKNHREKLESRLLMGAVR